MTQQSYNLICKILSVGAPALAEDLIGELNNLIKSHQTLMEEKQVKDDRNTKEAE